MEKQYEFEVKENLNEYLKIFWEHYKNHQIFFRKKIIFALISLVAFILLLFITYIDFGKIIFSDSIFLLEIVILFCCIGYVVPSLAVFLEIKQIYQQYWTARKILYKTGTYTQNICFLPNGLKISGYRKEKPVAQHIDYTDVAQIRFYRNGIIIQPQKSQDYIYITKKQLKEKSALNVIKNWYKEYTKNGKNQL